MIGDDLELVRGSGNAFRDLGLPNPDVAQLKAMLAAEIIQLLDRENLTVRLAHARTGMAAADFSRIRNADLGRFTCDRLINTLNRLGTQVEVALMFTHPTVSVLTRRDNEPDVTEFFKHRARGVEDVQFLEILRAAPNCAPEPGDELDLVVSARDKEPRSA